MILTILICHRREEFMHWVEMLPDTQTPSWLGLPSNAEKVLLTTQGTPPVTLAICILVVFHIQWIFLRHLSSFFFMLFPHLNWCSQRRLLTIFLFFYSSVLTLILTRCLIG